MNPLHGVQAHLHVALIQYPRIGKPPGSTFLHESGRKHQKSDEEEEIVSVY